MATREQHKSCLVGTGTLLYISLNIENQDGGDLHCIYTGSHDNGEGT